MPLFNLPASFNDAMAIFDQRKWTEFAIQGHRYKEWSDWRCSKPEEDVDTGTVAEHVEDIKCGDLFCIVLGCSFPLVVRRREAGDFIILGEGYIQGYMDGELAVQIERGEMTVEDLTFS